ncbi:glycosyltransferase family 4 protein [Gloeocapsa sp. PCC 73106]|uniref:glycosyltransferase family 4 protein n=1 Tax=Gloeocapsa sp. PCC 73106 TaxID=102232 RepID=UPI0002ACCB0B|nr:glycosyltransferase family 4 protein [Gloeocapsa sp. PCC 73106]ELR99193.1 glycosyltransferase [Gloeocapsa sp. PCC 73106]
MLRLLFLSTPVGPLGSGLGGGVELTLYNLAEEMQRRGHEVVVVAPSHSLLSGINLVKITGNLQIPAQTQTRDVPISLPENGVLANMWEYAHTVQTQYDLIVNFAFDWLPFYLTRFFSTPIAHFISMGSMSLALDHIMNQVAETHPGTIGVYTRSQAETFAFADTCEILSSAVDLSLYQFCAQPDNCLAWVGRIAPEKALEDGVAAAVATGIPLKIWGKIQDEDYWQSILSNYPGASLEYCGFLSTEALGASLGRCRALLMTPRWIEAFGNVAIEAMACGVPVISYARGGPTEIIRQGETGFLVPPDQVSGLVTAIESLDQIDRCNCRLQAEREYSLEALGDRFESWFDKIIKKD